MLLPWNAPLNDSTHMSGQPGACGIHNYNASLSFDTLELNRQNKYFKHAQ